MSNYNALKSDHDAIRGGDPIQDAEIDAMRSNGAFWDKTGYAALAVICCVIGFGLIFG